MSQYVSQLEPGDVNNNIHSGRDRVGDWPPCGTWGNDFHFNDLRKFANALSIPKIAAGADRLDSIPTPWARLLLFESALHDENHPAHDEITSQWRGLLGALALADLLLLKVETTRYDLSAAPQDSFIQAFNGLRPGGPDEVPEHWHRFQMISVDDGVLGSTSPRTLVFTSVAHRCPRAIPFRSPEGRLADPVAYYESLRDVDTLSLLNGWIRQLQQKLGTPAPPDDPKQWLGKIPGATRNDDRWRSGLLTERLEEWGKDAKRALQDLGVALQAAPQLKFGPGPFNGFPYNLIEKLKRETHYSDLFVERRRQQAILATVTDQREHRKQQTAASGAGNETLVGFNQRDSEIVDDRGQPYRGRLQVWDQLQVALGPSACPITLPPASQLSEEAGKYTVMNDPCTELFEDVLIRVDLPKNQRWAYGLKLGERSYLFPLKARILELFSNEQIAQNTTLEGLDNDRARVAVRLPLRNGKYIQAHKDFRVDEIVSCTTPSVAVWPDFTHKAWNRYFYVVARTSPTDMDLHIPSDKNVVRGGDNEKWYVTESPARILRGSVNGKCGLLLLKRNDLLGDAIRKWKVAVDFGSTHTRAFYVRVDNNQNYQPGDIQPVKFTTLSQPVTDCNSAVLQQKFFALENELTPRTREEFETLLMLPNLNARLDNKWLPEEGYIYPHWFFKANYDAEHLRHDLKWSSADKGRDLYALFYCLITMIKAEALKQGALVEEIQRAYPSVLPEYLKDSQDQQWTTAAKETDAPLKSDATAGKILVQTPVTSVLPEYLKGSQDQQWTTAAKETDAPLKSDATAGKILVQTPVTEAVAVSRFLTWELGAHVDLNTISLDVGGSTTDIAVWSGGNLRIEESLKVAADILGRFVQSDEGGAFRTWLVNTLARPTYEISAIDLNAFAKQRDGYSLMFNNILMYLNSAGTLDNLVALIKTAPAAEKAIAALTFLFSALLYYTGLLARKTGMTGNETQVYFCGKGGSLISWLNNYQSLVSDMFNAGFGRADKDVQIHSASQERMDVGTHPPKLPKQEVGRGLLALAGLNDERPRGEGQDRSKRYPMTAGESGYKYKDEKSGQERELQWNDELTEEIIKRLSEVPKLNSLLELNKFVECFKTSRATAASARLLGLDNGLPQAYWQRLHGRFFNQAQGNICYDARNNRALLEPFFITEIKVLAGLLDPPVDLYR